MVGRAGRLNDGKLYQVYSFTGQGKLFRGEGTKAEMMVLKARLERKFPLIRHVMVEG